jgi:predicted nucleic acid-binding protein
VKVYLDTNIIVADAVSSHVHNASAAGLLRQIESRQWTPVLVAHGLAEIYSVLTRTPYRPRITPAQAWQIIEQNVLASFEIEALSRSEYSRVIKECAAQGWSGGRIHDVLHIAAARKARCGRIYTFDVTHFRQLAPDLLDRIMAP